MKLVLPSYKYKEQYISLVKSAKRNNDVFEMGNAYRENESFNHMLIRLKDRRNGKNLSKKDVKSVVYFIIVDNNLVGTIDARQTLNDNYFSRLGHVAYYIKPEERNKGFATNALSLVLKKYQKKKIYNILITCFKDNIVSKKVIEKNNGIFEKEFYDKITNKGIG